MKRARREAREGDEIHIEKLVRSALRKEESRSHLGGIGCMKSVVGEILGYGVMMRQGVE